MTAHSSPGIWGNVALAHLSVRSLLADVTRLCVIFSVLFLGSQLVSDAELGLFMGPNEATAIDIRR